MMNFFIYLYLNNINMKISLNSGLKIQAVDTFHERIDTIQQSVDRLVVSTYGTRTTGGT